MEDRGASVCSGILISESCRDELGSFIADQQIAVTCDDGREYCMERHHDSEVAWVRKAVPPKNALRDAPVGEPSGPGSQSSE
jgi:hypothetical protein